ncbi:multi-sensor signal transduction histidine kinase [Nostoc carneum NIES-2107]|nr:multi-sensor signal transduction histidine kinase [Nostoc carneum NIES-2107]
MRSYQRLLPYGIAIGSTAIALMLSLWLEDLLYRTIGAFFYIAVILSSWYGGFQPGCVTVVLSVLAIDYFVIPPRYAFLPSQPGDVLRLALFLGVALTMNLLTANFRKSKQKIDKLSQKLAQENAEQLRMALSAAQMGIWDWDIVTGIIKWSPEHEILFGLTPGSFNGRYESFEACVHPDDRSLTNQALQQSLQTHSAYKCEFRVIWPDESIHWVEGRGQAFYKEVDQPIRMTGTVMAIDDRKRSETERLQSQILLSQQFEQQRLVMEMTQRIRRSLNLQDILQTTVDEVRQFLRCDRVIIFKFSPSWGGTIVVESVVDESLALLPLEIYDPCIGEENVAPFLQGLVTAKTDIYTAGISPCHVEFLASLQVRANLVVPIIEDNELWGLLAAHHCTAPREWQAVEIDLMRQLASQSSVAIRQAHLFAKVQTELIERQQAQAALQEREAILRLFAQYAPAGIAMFDRDMCYLMSSKRWVDDYNLDSVAALIGRSHYEIFPEITQRWREIHQQCLAGATARSDEDLFVRLDGNQQWIHWEIHPWYHATGEIGGIIIFSDDVTERKQAQIALVQLNVELEQRIAERTEQLKEINARLLETVIEQQQTQLILFEQAQILDLAHDTIMTLDLNWRITFWNEGAEQMYGFLKAEAVGQISHDLLQTQFPQPLPEIQAQFLATGYWEGELIHFRRDAQPVIVASRWVLQKDHAGNPLKILEINNDITSTKQAEKMLEFQAVITRNMAEGVCLVRASDAVIVYANPKFEQMFGYDSGELNGQHVSMINYGNESVTAEDVNQAIRAAVLSKGEATYEVHNVKKDGTPFWCYATTSVFSHPEYGDVLVAVHQDITDRKLIQDALRESEEKFRQMADNIQAIFWITDSHYQQVLYVSKAYESIWQRSREELYHNISAWVEAVHPDDRQRLDVQISEQANTGEQDKQYRIIRPDGSIRWIRDRAFPIKNEQGEIIRIAGIAEDITAQQEIEQMKREFIGIVSHELRTPLTSIRASLGLLNSDLYKQKPEKSQRMLAIAARESDRLVRLVNDILDLERLDSGRVTLQTTICTVTDLFEQAVAGVQALAKQQNITLNIQPTDAQVCVAADAILQTLTNLLSNAIKFSPADSTITLSVEQQSDRVLFSISDQGRGIPKDKLEKIFNRFQQVDASDSRVKGGTGLGLAICRSIIDQHGGKIWAESTLGVGSTFFFTLPLVRD